MKPKNKTPKNTKSFDDYVKTRLTPEEIAEINEKAHREAQILRALQKINPDNQNNTSSTENTDSDIP